MTTVHEKGYQGWTNYETWACKLWMDNDQGTQEYFHKMRDRILRHPTYQNEFMPKESRKVHELAEALKAEHEEQAERFMGNQASFFADIFNAALSSVNWHEIAESLIEEAEEGN